MDIIAVQNLINSTKANISQAFIDKENALNKECGKPYVIVTSRYEFPIGLAMGASGNPVDCDVVGINHATRLTLEQAKQAAPMIENAKGENGKVLTVSQAYDKHIESMQKTLADMEEILENGLDVSATSG